MAFTKVSVGGGGSANMASPAQGGMAAGNVKGWHPTVLYMGGLILLEIIIVGFLSRNLFSGGE